MSKLMKANIAHTIMWTAVAVGLAVIFCMPNTIANWGDNRVKTVLLAILFLFGFATDFALSLIEKSKKRGFKRDERDDKVQSQAIFKAFVVVVLYIYIVSMTLYIIYENVNVMPVGWVWFMAYSTIVVANLFTGLFAWIGYKKQGL